MRIDWGKINFLICSVNNAIKIGVEISKYLLKEEVSLYPEWLKLKLGTDRIYLLLVSYDSMFIYVDQFSILYSLYAKLYSNGTINLIL